MISRLFRCYRSVCPSSEAAVLGFLRGVLVVIGNPQYGWLARLPSSR